MENKNEKLLSAWLHLTQAISNKRLTPDMPFNESLICYTLYCNQLQEKPVQITATDLCREIKMLKSQMNRTLTTMEQKGMILRERSTLDKRQVYVTLNPTYLDTYVQHYQKVLAVVGAIAGRIGPEKTDEATELFNIIADIAREVT